MYLRNTKKILPASVSTYNLFSRQEDGYLGLKLLIGPTHPFFAACSILSSGTPRQQHQQDILAFYDEFLDHLEVQQVFNGSNHNIGDKHTILLFLRSCRYGDYLESRFNQEYHNPQLAAKFTKSNLGATVCNWFLDSNFKLHLQHTQSLRGASGTPRGFRSPGTPRQSTPQPYSSARQSTPQTPFARSPGPAPSPSRRLFGTPTSTGPSTPRSHVRELVADPDDPFLPIAPNDDILDSSFLPDESEDHDDALNILQLSRGVVNCILCDSTHPPNECPKLASMSTADQAQIFQRIGKANRQRRRPESTPPLGVSQLLDDTGSSEYVDYTGFSQEDLLDFQQGGLP